VECIKCKQWSTATDYTTDCLACDPSAQPTNEDIEQFLTNHWDEGWFLYEVWKYAKTKTDILDVSNETIVEQYGNPVVSMLWNRDELIWDDDGLELQR